MTTPAWHAPRKVHFRFSPYLLAVALAPAVFQTSTSLSCGGDTSLSEFEVFVEGENQIVDFDPDQRRYSVLLEPGTSEARVRTVSADPGARVWMDIFVDGEQFASDGYGSSQGYGVGGQDEVVPVPAESSVLRVWVSPPGGTTGFYEVNLTLPEFPCTEQGVRDAIAEGGGPHGFKCDGPTTVVTTNEIVIDNDVILDGQGRLTVDGGDDHRVFSLAPQVTADLRNLGVAHGNSTIATGIGDGGGVLVEAGELILTKCAVIENTATSGGALSIGDGRLGGAPATVTIIESTISGNVATIYSGGAILSDGTVMIIRSDLSDNVAETDGGGIWSSVEGTLTVIDSTLSGNTALGNPFDGGGAIYSNRGTLTVSGSTISNNDAGVSGGGLTIRLGTASITNTTVSNNTALVNGGIEIISSGGSTMIIESTTVSGNTGIDIQGRALLQNAIVDGDCSDGPVFSWGYNIESPGDTCGFDQPTDQVNVAADDLKLGPLQDNGGPTMTHALLPGSVAVDVIPEADCLDADGAPLTTDQRGEPRPETGGTMCDIGAFEAQP